MTMMTQEQLQHEYTKQLERLVIDALKNMHDPDFSLDDSDDWIYAAKRQLRICSGARVTKEDISALIKDNV